MRKTSNFKHFSLFMHLNKSTFIINLSTNLFRMYKKIIEIPY